MFEFHFYLSLPNHSHIKYNFGKLGKVYKTGFLYKFSFSRTKTVFSLSISLDSKENIYYIGVGILTFDFDFSIFK